MIQAFGKFAVVEEIKEDKEKSNALRLGAVDAMCTARLISIPDDASQWFTQCGKSIVVMAVKSLSELPSFQVAQNVIYYFVPLDIIAAFIIPELSESGLEDASEKVIAYDAAKARSEDTGGFTGVYLNNTTGGK